MERTENSKKLKRIIRYKKFHHDDSVRNFSFRLELPKLIDNLLKDLGCCAKDRDYVINRFKNEGCHFITHSLPQYEKYVLACIEAESILNPASGSYPTSFQWCRRSPLFLRGFLLRAVYNNCGHSLAKIRQICLILYKLVLPSRPNSVDPFIGFTETDRSLTLPQDEKSKQLRSLGEKISKTIFKPLEKYHPHDIYRGDDTGLRHGPGTFQRKSCLLGNKPPSAIRTAPDSVVGTVPGLLKPYSGYFKPLPRKKRLFGLRLPRVESVEHFHRINGKDSVLIIEPGQELRYSYTRVSEGLESFSASEILFVPKDSRGPRVISKEEPHMVRAQLAFFDFIAPKLEFLTKNGINFKDQSFNKLAAIVSSTTRSFATLDLKDASDRNSLALCKKLFNHVPVLRHAIEKLRSPYYFKSSRNPTARKEYRIMEKLATMGNGICFPFLAMSCYVAAVTGIVTSGYSIREAMNNILVYGDDIIVPSQCYDHVRSSLIAFGLKVNEGKSFRKGFFRESCGSDYMNGVDVTPIRLKLTHSNLSSPSRLDGSVIIPGQSATVKIGTDTNSTTSSKGRTKGFRLTVNQTCVLELVDFANACFARGYQRVFLYVKNMIEAQMGTLPWSTRKTGFLAWIDTNPYTCYEKLRASIDRYKHGFSVVGLESDSIRLYKPFTVCLAPESTSEVKMLREGIKASLNAKLEEIPFSFLRNEDSITANYHELVSIVGLDSYVEVSQHRTSHNELTEFSLGTTSVESDFGIPYPNLTNLQYATVTVRDLISTFI